MTWNVQWCRGMDGVVDPARIAAEIKRIADPDVVCLQEIAANWPDLPGSRGEDQPHALMHALPAYEGCLVSGVDMPAANGRRSRFGNLILSRLKVGRVLRHSLPWPAAEGIPSMPRVAVEAVIEAPFGPLRVITTHLEYHSKVHRALQIDRLGELHAEACQPHNLAENGPYASPARPASAIVCGDFNLPAGDSLHARMLSHGFVDAWQALHPDKPHPPTFRLYETDKGYTPYCCDFIFVTPDLVPRLKSIRIEGATKAADHQPVILELG